MHKTSDAQPSYAQVNNIKVIIYTVSVFSFMIQLFNLAGMFIFICDCRCALLFIEVLDENMFALSPQNGVMCGKCARKK